MYAIIDIGGKQAKVAAGDVVSLERRKDAGESLSFTPLLVVDGDGNAITDKKQLSAATVTATVLGEERGPKINIFKYKNKSGYRRRKGHRQTYTNVEVTAINLG